MDSRIFLRDPFNGERGVFGTAFDPAKMYLKTLMMSEIKDSS